MQEVWKPVPFPNLCDHYEVSSFGRVKRLTDSTAAKAGQILKCPVSNKWGHVKCRLYLSGQCKSIWLHRLVALTFLGAPPSPKHEVAHNDGNAGNNRADNLRWATSAENKADCLRHGTRVTGERHYRAKITMAQADEIRRLYVRGQTTHQEIADKFGIHRVNVGLIVRNKAWRKYDADVS